MGLINWFKEKKLDELSYEIKQMRRDIELLDSSLENIKTQVRSMRTLVYRKKYGHQDEDEDEEKQQMTPQEIQRALLGLGN